MLDKLAAKRNGMRRQGSRGDEGGEEGEDNEETQPLETEDYGLEAAYNQVGFGRLNLLEILVLICIDIINVSYK